MPAYLEAIIRAHRAADAAIGPADQVIDRALQCEGGPRNFRQALSGKGLSLIAEVKRRSPSEGALNQGLDPVSLATSYVEGGADCISVLTDEEFFGGSAADLAAVRAAIAAPILRKDFAVSLRDVAETRLMGADAVLLIVAALSDEELASMHALALRLGLAALVEVHDVDELARARSIDGVALIGVNQRNLKTFEMTDAASRLRKLIPSHVISVCESGIATAEDARQMHNLGYDGVLVGSSLVRSGNPAEMCRAIKGS